MTELQIPEDARSVNPAHEILRAWLVDKRVVCSLPSWAHDQSAAWWGDRLADIAIAAANDLSARALTDQASILTILRERLELGTGSYKLETHMRHLKPYDEIVSRFHAESDRAAAVLGGAALDVYLGQALREFLVDHEDCEALFFKYGPLATFAARIDMSFALGLISAEWKRSFNLVRKVRNYFAHDTADATFETSPVREWCRELTVLELVDHDGKRFEAPAPRFRYLLCIGLGIGRMGVVMQQQRRRTSPA